MAGGGETAAFLREETFFDVAEFHHKFAVSCVFNCIWLGFGEVGFVVMEFGPDFAGKEESTADTDGADGVEFVRVKEDFCFESFWDVVVSEAVRFDAVGDL